MFCFCRRLSLQTLIHVGCYISVWDLRTSQRLAKKQHPFTNVPNITIIRNKVDIIPHLEETLPIWTWDLHTDEIQTISPFQLCNVDLQHMDVGENVLVTLGVNWNEHPPLVQQTSWTLTTTEQLISKTFRLPLAGRRVSKNNIWTMCRRTFGRRTRTELYLNGGYTTIIPRFHLTYDPTIVWLSVQLIGSTTPITNFVRSPCIGCPLTPYIDYRWISTNPHRIAVCNAATGKTTIRPYQLDI